MTLLERIAVADKQELQEIVHRLMFIAIVPSEILHAISNRRYDLQHADDIEETENSLKGKI